ncbi:MAG: cytochrome c3 family protein [Gemmatimonadota bacterium]
MRKPYGTAALTVILPGLALAAWLVVRDAPEQSVPPLLARAGEAAEGQATGTRAQAAAVARAQAAAVARAQATGGTRAQAGPAPAAQTAEEAIAAHESASRGPRQPLPFSHRFHATELQIDCLYCHTGTERSPMGLVPSLEVCNGCHRVAGSGLAPIDELRQYWARGEPVPWEWVNKVPDFVQFKHRPHLRNGIECQTCHGPVEEMDRVYQWAPFTMGWCLECHRSQPAEGDVATDRQLVAANPPPEPPPERQPGSVYPRGIDQKYGAYRAPIDCTVCHY